MIALDKDNLPIKATDESFGCIVAGFPNHIAKDIDKIAFADFCIPSTDKFGIHFIHGIKGALIKTDDVFVSPMRICCKKYFLSFHKITFRVLCYHYTTSVQYFECPQT